MLKYILPDFITNSSHYSVVLDSVYYSIIFISLSIGFYLVYKRLKTLGYDERQIKIFTLLTLILSYPLGIIGARAISIFYYPSHFWSMNFLIDQLIYGKYVTAHAAPFLPIIAISILIVLMKFKFLEVWDTIFLYAPLAHAFGRVACLLVGCCWGNPVSCTLFGHALEFDNPIPLYAIFYKTMIFLFLRACFNKIYSSDDNREYRGLITALYFILYGNIRLVVEIFRTTKIVSWGLTQAQIGMICFITLGSLIFLAIMLKNFMKNRNFTKTESKTKTYFSLLGFSVYFLILGAAYYYLSSKQIVSWPFHTVHNISEAYRTISEYIPALFIACLSLVWLKLADIPIMASFRWQRFSSLFYVGLIACMVYSIYMLKPIRFGLHIYFIWPPVLVLSILNAFTEEVVFRLVLFRLLMKATNNAVFSNLIQALAYSAIHVFIGGPVFAAQAFALGVLLGFIMEKDESVVPCMICHFCVDLGAIGYPILSS